ncbi:frizzled receptor, partial [Cichlidogyrus casuarinus]
DQCVTGQPQNQTKTKLKQCDCKCGSPYVEKTDPPFDQVSTGGVKGCVPSCYAANFSSDPTRTFAQFWLGFWAMLCAVSTLATLATFAIDSQRFLYPQRPIVYLAACYLLVSIGYLVSVGLGHEKVACENSQTLRVRTTGPAHCSIIFLLTYLFGMSGAVWWVVLTFTWFLSAGLKWGSEAIAKYSQSYHFVAWFFPGVQSLFVLTMSAVDGDPVGGLCYVGSSSLQNLKLFVIAPSVVYLILGTFFLLAGFMSMVRIRSAMKMQDSMAPGKTSKFEKLMARIGVFSVLYSVPVAIVIACNIYDLNHRLEWEKSITCDCSERKKKSANGAFEMEYAVFMLKYFMSLAVGTTTGFWILSAKTVRSWSNCLTGRKAQVQNSPQFPFQHVPLAYPNRTVVGNLSPALVTQGQNWYPGQQTVDARVLDAGRAQLSTVSSGMSNQMPCSQSSSGNKYSTLSNV